MSAAANWKLQDAKARFSEVVRRAREDGPQRVSVRGRDAVVVIAAEEFDRIAAPQPLKPMRLTEFLKTTGFDQLDLERETDRGRDINWEL